MTERPLFRDIRVATLDWDGTMVDSVPYKIAQNQAIAREFGRNLSIEDVRQEWNKAQDFKDLMFRLTNCEDMNAIMRVVKRDYSNPAYAKRNFAFGRAALAKLRASSLHTAIITNVTHEILNLDSQQLGYDLSNDFDFTQASDEHIHKKPDGRTFDILLGHFGISAAQMLYVGDEMKDYETAVNAGAKFIGVTTSMTTADEFIERGIPYVANISEVVAYTIPKRQNRQFIQKMK